MWVYYQDVYAYLAGALFLGMNGGWTYDFI